MAPETGEPRLLSEPGKHGARAALASGASWARHREGCKVESALQDVMVAKHASNTNESGDLVNSALQDVMASQQLVLIGLIAKMTDSTLQDEIASTSRRLIRLGQDVMSGVRNDGKATVVRGERAASTAPI